jgi:hypothetical protein
MTGLLRLLIHIDPDLTLFQTIFKLPDSFDPLPASVLAMWSVKSFPALKAYILSTDGAPDDILRQLNKWQLLFPEKPLVLVHDEHVRKWILHHLSEHPSSYTALASALENHRRSPPPKKQRLE